MKTNTKLERESERYKTETDAVCTTSFPQCLSRAAQLSEMEMESRHITDIHGPHRNFILWKFHNQAEISAMESSSKQAEDLITAAKLQESLLSFTKRREQRI